MQVRAFGDGQVSRSAFLIVEAWAQDQDMRRVPTGIWGISATRAQKTVMRVKEIILHSNSNRARIAGKAT